MSASCTGSHRCWPGGIYAATAMPSSVASARRLRAQRARRRAGAEAAGRHQPWRGHDPHRPGGHGGRDDRRQHDEHRHPALGDAGSPATARICRLASHQAHVIGSLLVRPDGSTYQAVHFDRATGTDPVRRNPSGNRRREHLVPGSGLGPLRVRPGGAGSARRCGFWPWRSSWPATHRAQLPATRRSALGLQRPAGTPGRRIGRRDPGRGTPAPARVVQCHARAAAPTPHRTFQWPETMLAAALAPGRQSPAVRSPRRAGPQRNQARMLQRWRVDLWPQLRVGGPGPRAPVEQIVKTRSRGVAKPQRHGAETRPAVGGGP